MNAPHSTALSVHQAIPQAPGFDNTTALLAEGYRFIGNRCDELGADLFSTRLMLRRVVCMRGEAAARMFHHPGRFTLLDGETHRARKAPRLPPQSPASRQRLVDLAEREWRMRVERWPRQRRLVLIQEAQAVLCRAACAWAGVPLASVEEEVLRTAEFSAMLDGAGAVGPRNWLGLSLRRHTKQWALEHIAAVRAGRPTDPGSPLAAIAFDVDAGGEVLSAADAALELIDLLLPVVAVARTIVFGALAMHAHPQWGARLASGDDADLAMFVEEVRRFYPFLPAIGGRANQSFAWNGLQFDKGDWVLLDVYGTHRHPGIWPDGDVFRPERFEKRDSRGVGLIAQDGDPLTIELSKSALRLLARDVSYAVPPQALGVDLARMPALPASGFVIEGVRTA